jgi:hypothetical protein
MWKKFKPLWEFCGFISFLWGGIGMITNSGGILFLNITYEFIYSGLLAIGIVTISFVFTEFCFYLYNNRENLFKQPDTSIQEALDYIVNYSRLGKSLQSNQHGRNDAVKALKSSILSNKINLYGTNDLNPLPKKIKPKEINNDNLEMLYVEVHNNVEAISYISHGEEKNELYKNLLIPLKQLEKQFKQK